MTEDHPRSGPAWFRSIERRISVLERMRRAVGLPSGGTAGQMLTKSSSAEGDAGWSTPRAVIPPENTFTPASLPSAFPTGFSTSLVYPHAGSPAALAGVAGIYGQLSTDKAYPNAGGATQYWTSYQSSFSGLFVRQAYYNVDAWTPWKQVATTDAMPNPNLIINGSFRTNQRGYVSGTDLAANVYGFDRWKVYTANSRMNFTAAPQGQEITIPAGDAWYQEIERANCPAGEYVLSWKGTAQALLVKTGLAASFGTSPFRYTSDGTGNLMVLLGNGTVSDVKVERGTVATPYILDDISVELARCQRYYFRITGENGVYSSMLGTGVYFSTTFCYFPLQFPVTMRALPTIERSSATAAITVLYGSAGRATTSVTGSNSTRNTARIELVTAAATLGLPMWAEINPGHWISGSAEL